MPRPLDRHLQLERKTTKMKLNDIVITEIEDLIDMGEKLSRDTVYTQASPYYVHAGEVSNFTTHGAQLIRDLYGTDNQYFCAWEKILTDAKNFNSSLDTGRASIYISKLVGILKAIHEKVKNNKAKEKTSAENSKIDPIENLKRIFLRFRKIAKQLEKRHSNRPAITIGDEYDVQDLLHSLLHLYFEDIRPEEWTPSVSGKPSRMDFLLKEECIVIEVKITKENHGLKEIGEELIVDIIKYQKHPNCKTLICFIYDPDTIILNSKALEDILPEQSDTGFKVLLFVSQ